MAGPRAILWRHRPLGQGEWRLAGLATRRGDRPVEVGRPAGRTVDQGLDCLLYTSPSPRDA
eukprot:7414723-Heterocapsa_arctica.AAC.1